jgi:hypothetical protein
MKISMKNFVAAMLLFSAFAVSGHLTAAEGSWKFKENRVFNNMNGSVATITAERYDTSGGSVDLQLKGDILSFCPGGFEKMRFTWSFPDNITEIVNGSTISSSLDARQTSKSQNCGTQLASRSFMYIYNGGFALEGNSSIDERFKTGNGFRATAAEYENSGTATLKVNTQAFNPKKPLAYFEVCIQTPTRSGGGYLCYAYVYEYSGGSTGGGTGSSNCYASDPGMASTNRNDHYDWAQRQDASRLKSNLKSKVNILYNCSTVGDEAFANAFADFSVVIAQNVPNAPCFNNDQGVISTDRNGHYQWAKTKSKQQLYQNLLWKMLAAFNCLNDTAKKAFFADLSVSIAKAGQIQRM